MKYIIASIITFAIYHLIYKWLDKSKWFNSQFETENKEK